jgi:hypothetical protein
MPSIHHDLCKLPRLPHLCGGSGQAGARVVRALRGQIQLLQPLLGRPVLRPYAGQLRQRAAQLRLGSPARGKKLQAA